MSKNAVLGGLIGVAIVVIGLVVWANRAGGPEEGIEDQIMVAVESPAGAASPTATAALTPQAVTQIKSAHFVDSTPLHGEVYAAQPINVTLNFNFDLGEGSKMRVRSQDGKEWQAGEAAIEDEKTALKIPLKPGMSDGNYMVDYTACWPDRSCHDGEFSFAIDSSKKSEYKDLRGQKEITVDMKNIAFAQPKIMISPGTKITWVNNDSVGHYVNTETHPEHTYFPAQNSREIAPGQSFTTTFITPGQYNYHCSAHVPEGMVGSIIVDKS